MIETSCLIDFTIYYHDEIKKKRQYVGRESFIKHGEVQKCVQNAFENSQRSRGRRKCRRFDDIKIDIRDVYSEVTQ